MPNDEILFTVGAYEGFSYCKDVMPLDEFATTAERLGFDGISVGGLPASSDESKDPLITLAYAAAKTERVLLNTSVLVLPLYHPVFVAKQVAELDVLSRGRVVLGVGVGERAKPHEALGIPMNARGARTDEGIEILKACWTQPSFSYHGRAFQLRDISMAPKPVQKPHPPIWIGGRMGGVEIGPDGRPRFKSKTAAIRRAARYGDGWFPYLMTPDQYRESVVQLKAYVKEYGRPDHPMTMAHNIFFVIRDTYQEALREAANLPRPRRGEVRGAEFVTRFDVVGSPKDCVKRLEEYVDAGVRHFVCKPLPSGGEVSHRKEILKQMELLAHHIVPQFK